MSAKGRRQYDPPQIPGFEFLAFIRKNVIKEIDDPWGRVNAVGGLFLFAFTASAVLRYFAGSVSLSVDTSWLQFEIEPSGPLELGLAFLMFLLSLAYWVGCICHFAQLQPFRKVNK